MRLLTVTILLHDIHNFSENSLCSLCFRRICSPFDFEQCLLYLTFSHLSFFFFAEKNAPVHINIYHMILLSVATFGGTFHNGNTKQSRHFWKMIALTAMITEVSLNISWNSFIAFNSCICKNVISIAKLTMDH